MLTCYSNGSVEARRRALFIFLMNIFTYCFQNGEHTVTFQGTSGSLEGIVQCPKNLNPDYANIVAVLGHPHSLYGGTMGNKVVTTLARAFQELGIPSIRFNFRGVGQSQGVYDGGVGESEDILSLIQQCLKKTPDARFILAGFSFGSFVTYRAAAHSGKEVVALISIAPAVQHYDFTAFKHDNLPWLIIQGEEDDTALPEAVYAWHETLDPQPMLIKMPETGHFFHGRLGILQSHLITQIPLLLA